MELKRYHSFLHYGLKVNGTDSRVKVESQYFGVWRHGGAPSHPLGPLCVVCMFSQCLLVFLRLLWLPPTVQKHAGLVNR